jgi:hypothetical protein
MGISIDHFEVGQCPLVNLRRLRFGGIKADRFFARFSSVCGCRRNPSGHDQRRPQPR